jgi:hypothetical protein
MLNSVNQKYPTTYGSIVSMAASGIGQIISIFKTDKKLKDQELAKATTSLFSLLNNINQFQNQKMMIDYEWKSIYEEWESIKTENSTLFQQQLDYYKIDTVALNYEYYSTLPEQQLKFQIDCKTHIESRLDSLHKNTNNRKWQSQVEKSMYKIQSLRLRFGEIALRMQLNIKRYNEIVSNFQSKNDFDINFVENLTISKDKSVKLEESFIKQFKPQQYIEESSVMYIQSE